MTPMFINVRTINNTIEKREVSPLVAVRVQGRVLAQLAPEGAKACVLNDRVVYCTDSDWASLVPEDGSTVTFILTPGGIEIGAALVAAALFAAKAVLAAVVTFAVNTLIGKLLAPTNSLAGTGPKANSRKESPAYGFEEIQNGRNPRGAVPLFFGGPHDVGGHIIAAWRSAEDEKGNHYLYVIQCLSEGPIESIGDYTTDQNNLSGEAIGRAFRLNDLFAEDLAGVTVSLRMGGLSQSVMPGFSEINNEYAQRYKVYSKAPWFYWETREPIHAFVLQFEFPVGLHGIDSETGDTEKENFQFEATVHDLETGDLVFSSGRIRIKRKAKSRFWWQWRKDGLEFKKYRIGVYSDLKEKQTRMVELVAVNEIQYAALSYPGLALVGWRIKASEQISGGFPRIIVSAKGLKVQTTSGTQWSNNPFDIIRGILLDKNWGLGRHIEADDLDDASGQEFQNWCDELIPPFTGAETLEKRAELDIILDAPRGAWEVIQALAATARGSALKIGSLIKFKIDKPELATQLFTSGSIIRDSVSVQSLSRRSRPNRINVNFRDRDNQFKQESQPSEFAFIDEGLGELNSKDQDMWGIVRRTQANRHANYLLRHEMLVGSRIKFEVPISAIVSEPGDVVNVALESSRNGRSGRLAGVTPGGDTVIDRKFTFESGVLYTYREKSMETGEVLALDFSHEGTQTLVLPFAPLHGSDGAVGREYTVGEKFLDVRPWRIRHIRTAGEAFTREIEAMEYVAEVYSDEAEPPFVGDGGGGEVEEPDTVTDLAVTSETSEEAGVSLITIEWTSAGEGIGYIIYIREPGTASLSQIGTTTGESFTFAVSELRYDDNIEIIVASIDPSGGRSDPETSPGVVYKIRRETDGTAILELPGDVANPVWTDQIHADGNLYLLAWDAVADVDGYEVRAGSWHSGQVIHRGAGTSVLIRTGRIARRYFIRAYIGTEYSAGVLETESPVTGYQSFTDDTLPAGALDFSEATIINGVQVLLFGAEHVTQGDPELPLTVMTPEIDLGSSASTHVSLDVATLHRMMYSTDLLGIFADAISWTAFGEIRQPYQIATITLRHRASGGGSWSEFAFTDAAANETIVLSARYFQVVVQIVTSKLPTLDDVTSLTAFTRALVHHIKYAFYREP